MARRRTTVGNTGTKVDARRYEEMRIDVAPRRSISSRVRPRDRAAARPLAVADDARRQVSRDSATPLQACNDLLATLPITGFRHAGQRAPLEQNVGGA